MKHAVKYRPDIDGLRAIAILAVVLFHLNPKLLPGGYVGVDIFFVISGYLITSIIYREIRSGEFSLARFYERRIRRLFPALLVVMATSFMAAWIYLLPADFRMLSEALASTSLFIANLYFWKKTDYFSDPVDTLPLLHTWSLAVEEQFYIFFPLVLILLLRHKPGWLTGSLFVLLLLSLGGSEYALIDHPESVFYLPHYRAWELLAGAILAIGTLASPVSMRIKDALFAFGLMLIVGSLFLYDKETAFPGFSALPAVLGTALVIHSGEKGAAWAGRWLGWKPLVFIGLISYSLYLWHWPLFVLVRYVLPHGHSSLPIDISLLVAALALAAFSWHFVERPFRHGTRHRGQAAVFTTAALAIATMLILALPGIVWRGAPFRLPQEIVDIAAVGQEEIPFRKPCFGLDPEQVNTGNTVCVVGAKKPPTFLLWGDSHALALAHGVSLAAKELNISGYFLGRSLCPPVISQVNSSDYRKKCVEFNLATLHFLDTHPTVNTIVLAGYWTRYLNTPTTQNFSRDFLRLLDDLTAKGYRIEIIEQVPAMGWEVPSVLARSRLFGHDLPPATNRAKHITSLEAFRKVLQTTPLTGRIQMRDLSEVLCPNSACMVARHGMPLYRDANHLSKAGSTFLKEALKPAIHPL